MRNINLYSNNFFAISAALEEIAYLIYNIHAHLIGVSMYDHILTVGRLTF